ncbi:cytochrome P450 [Mariannaea sp. PMI_226]|nr:cytochrome P450 [Mariannaea sp. PMI_226]
MCYGATCPTCSKASWRGCGSHVPQALAGIPENKWCTCNPRTKINGKEYPPAAKFEIPGVAWLTSMFGGGASLAGGVILLLAVYLTVRLKSPLSKVPGPVLSNFTSLILKWHEVNANRTMYIHHLHQKYGPVVRVAPNEVSFTSPAALKQIYGSGGSGYDKTEFYNLFRVYGRRTMFSTLNKADHAKRKRMFGDRYANSNVMKSIPIGGIQERSKRFVQRCAQSPQGITDVFKKEDEEMMHQVAADDSLQNRLVLHYNPFLHRLISRVLYLFAKPRETPLADNYVLDTANVEYAADFTVLNRLKGKDGELDTIGMAAECLDHMTAGIDTTGDVLCFLMWELSQPRSHKYQRRLQEELRANPDVPFDKLEFLDAVLNEGLRCFPAIPMSLPRYTPQGGCILDGYSFPERTIVSCQAFSIHRINDDVFPDPDTFYPDRWLEAEGDADRRRLQWAFSSGGRGCVGKHLALAEMKTLLRDVYSQFKTEPDASMKSESMAMSDQLISARPLGKRCLLKFVPLEDTELDEAM